MASFNFSILLETPPMIVVAIIGILAAIAIPQYQNYIAKSQVSRVMGELSSIKTTVETCILEGKTAVTNDSTEEDKDTCFLGATVSNLLGADGTEIYKGLTVKLPADAKSQGTIVGTFGNSAATAIKEKELTWYRSAEGSWTCGTTVESKFRPAGCASSGSTDSGS